MTTLLAFDSETFRIRPGSIAPKMVCGIFTSRGEDGKLETKVLGNHPDEGLEDMLEWVLTDDEVRIITQSGGFDYSVICGSYPRLIPLVYAKLIAAQATDTQWREKLLNLSTTGRLEDLYLPDGTKTKISYSMNALAQKYLGIDLTEEKESLEESWRANFSTLDGLRADEYPDDALDYCVGDGEHTLRIHEAQEARKEEWAMASTETEEFQLFKHFVLYLMSAWGMEGNPEAISEMEAATMLVMEENKDLLEAAGILRSAERIGPPYKKDEDAAYTLLAYKVGVANLPVEMGEDDWNTYRHVFEGSDIKFKKATGTPGSIDTKRLQAHLAVLFHKLGKIPEMTAGGEKEPQIKCDAEVQELLAEHCPIMEQYHKRKELGKIVTQMIPALRSGPVIYPSYDAIKETGRTSSYDGGKRKESGSEVRLYPSVNIQQIPKEIKGMDSRGCFRPRDGRVFFDVDFTGLELACVGHITYELFGESVHRDLYNAGVDLHGYLGAQLALHSPLDGHPLLGDFQSAVREEGISSDPMAVFEAFKALKSHDDEAVRKFFKHFRNFAKPVGLGFPGGLGPATMVEFARKTYGVILTEEQASQYRDFWRVTYPEMPKFFDWINGQTDAYNTGFSGESNYVYVTPMGMVRRGATFCAAANGMSMQSPGAEAAMMGAGLVSRACYDPTQESVLYGARPVAFIHDQVLGETTRDQELWVPQVNEAARLMREGAEMVLTSIKMRTDEAHLTAVWSKSSEPVFDAQGNLQVWRPAA